MSYRTVTGTVLKPDGGPWVSGRVSFRLENLSVVLATGEIFPPSAEKVITDVNGQFSISLWANESGDITANYIAVLPDRHEPQRISIPTGNGSLAIADLIAVGAIPPTDSSLAVIDSHIATHAAVHASADQLGHIRVGAGLAIDIDGILSNLETTEAVQDVIGPMFPTTLFAYDDATGTMPFAVQIANKVFAGPVSGSNIIPTFRSIVSADVPSLLASKISDFSSAVLAVAPAPAWGAITGTLSSQTDLQASLNAKQDSLGFTAVPNTRTVNGHVLSANVTVTPGDLSLVIGTNVQAWDTDLDSISALSSSNDDLIQRKAGVWANRTIAQLKSDLSLSGSNTGDQTVFGRSGNVVAVTNDYTWAQIDKTTSSLADVTTRSAGDLSSGTLLAARMPALTGDISTSAGAVATTIGAGKVTFAMLNTGAWSDDTTLAGNSATVLPTQHAVKTYADAGDAAALLSSRAYADALVVGLLDDRGNYDASINTFPASGGSGSAGAILKGDLWTISVAGTLGGTAVTAGDVVRALVDTPGQTVGNWAIGENNFGYVALNQALASGKIYVGNVSGVGTAVTPSGDVTMTNAGVFAIANLPAISGVNLTALNASNLGSGTVPLARLSGITNTEVSGSAAIAYSKLNLTGAILNADLAGSISLTTKVTGILPTANGGTGVAFFTAAGPTQARVYTFPDAAATIARTDAANTFTGHQTIEGVTSTGATGTGKFVFDNSPTLATPVLGVASATSLALGTNPAVSGTLMLPNNTYITARNAANNADINMIQVASNNVVQVGSASVAVNLGGLWTTNTGTGAFAASGAWPLSTTGGITGGSLALGGATIGSNALAVTGTSALGTATVSVGLTTSAATDLLVNPTTKTSGNLIDLQVNGSSKFKVDNTGIVTAATQISVSDSGGYRTGSNHAYLLDTGVSLGTSAGILFSQDANAYGTKDTFIYRGGAAATLHFGAADAASPVAQTTGVQGVVAGTSNTAGANWTLAGSVGTGTGTGGSIIFQVAPAGTTGSTQNALVAGNTGGMTITPAGQVLFPSGTAALPGIALNQQSSSGMFYGGGSVLSLTVAGTQIMDFTPTGTRERSGIFIIGPSAGDPTLRKVGTASLAFGAADAAAAVAQFTGVQGVVAGTTNTTGALWTFRDSVGTGTGASGGFAFQVAAAGSSGTAQNTWANALTIDSTLLVVAAGTGTFGFSGRSRMTSAIDGNIRFTPNNTSASLGNIDFGSISTSIRFNFAADVLTIQSLSSGTFSRVTLGGSTSSFPAIKRNAAAIDFRLADDSAYAAITSASHTFDEAANLILGTTTGTKLGTSVSQKLGLWNATPIVQPSGANQAALTDSTTGTPAFTLVDVGIVFSQSAINNNFASLNRQVDAFRTALVNAGIIKGAA